MLRSTFRTISVQGNGLPVRIVSEESRWRRLLVNPTGTVLLAQSAAQIGAAGDLPIDAVTIAPGQSFLIPPGQPMYAVASVGVVGARLSYHVSELLQD